AAEKKFKEINEAYEILSDPKKRAEYDQFGKSTFEGAQGFEGFRQQDFGTGFGGAEDIFSDLFSHFRRDEAPLRGPDLSTKFTISLEEAFNGVTKPITLSREVVCRSCQGTGAEASTTCSSCKGAGSVKQSRGIFRMSQPCTTCQGLGRVITKACKTCGGRGNTISAETIKVKIPPGADTGSRVRLKGMGGTRSGGGPAGDLFIELTVRPHPVFKREGNNIYVDVPVTFTDAVLGGKIKVPTLSGDVTMTLPPGTDSGKKFKLKGKGIPNRKTGVRGDEFAVIKILVPKNVSSKAKEALEEIDKAYKR
ncbi:MAG: DnaJ domain-containing protein, partial [Nitrospiraceae bacterium]